MIEYDAGKWSLHIMCMCKGSVFPTALMFATPCAVLAAALHAMLHSRKHLLNVLGIGDSAATVFGGFSFVLGFLVVFRAQLAYNRWWEGGTLLCKLRGEWFDSFSALISFCNADPTKEAEVACFQQQAVRLYSLLYCCALAQVSPNKDEVGAVSLNTFELINLNGMDPESLQFLQSCPDMSEVTLQWIQRLIVESEQKGILKIAPPILSRVYNELGNGIVNLNNARKIKDFPFPFPMAQMAMVMLVIHAFCTPLICAATVKTTIWASMITLVVTFCYWGVVYIALELEMPYGDDTNDLPLYGMAVDMNKSLRQLVEFPLARKVPPFSKTQAECADCGLDAWDVDLDTDLSVTARSGNLLSAEEIEQLQEISHSNQLRKCAETFRAEAGRTRGVIESSNSISKLRGTTFGATGSERSASKNSFVLTRTASKDPSIAAPDDAGTAFAPSNSVVLGACSPRMEESASPPPEVISSTFLDVPSTTSTHLEIPAPLPAPTSPVLPLGATPVHVAPLARDPQIVAGPGARAKLRAAFDRGSPPDAAENSPVRPKKAKFPWQKLDVSEEDGRGRGRLHEQAEGSLEEGRSHQQGKVEITTGPQSPTNFSGTSRRGHNGMGHRLPGHRPPELLHPDVPAAAPPKMPGQLVY